MKELLFTDISVHLENEPIVDLKINLVLCVTVTVTGAVQLCPCTPTHTHTHSSIYLHQQDSKSELPWKQERVGICL